MVAAGRATLAFTVLIGSSPGCSSMLQFNQTMAGGGNASPSRGDGTKKGRPRGKVSKSKRGVLLHLHSQEKKKFINLGLYRVAQKERNSRFLGLCSDQQLSFFTLLDRKSFPHYNNTKIMKFG